MTRAPLSGPLSPRQWYIVQAVCEGRAAREVAVELGVSEAAIRDHIRRAAQRINSDLPRLMRLVLWYRGASPDMLTGATVRHLPPPPLRRLSP